MARAGLWITRQPGQRFGKDDGMRTHPQRASVARVLFFATALAMLVAGCTTSGDPTPPTPRPADPSGSTPVRAPAFPALAGAESGVYETVTGLATDGGRTVATSVVHGNVDTASFLYSDDAGATWTRGSIGQDSAAHVAPGEVVYQPTVTKRPDGTLWLAISAVDDHFYSWTSRDGSVWARAELTGIVAAHAFIRAARGLDSGFVMVGSRDLGGSQPARPAVWLSSDGVNWTESLLPMGGWLGSVAMRGQSLVATGGTDLGAKASSSRQEAILSVRSTDGGKTWKQSTVAEPSGSLNFAAWAASVTATPSGFAAAGTYFIDSEKGYVPWVARSGDGVTWTQVAAPVAPNPGSRIGLLHSSAESLLVAQVDTVSGTRTLRLQRWDGKRWSQVTAPSDRPMVPDSGLAIGDRVELIAVEASTKPDAGELWRSADGGATFTVVTLPPAPSASAVVRPVALSAAGAYGLANGRSVTWARNADGSFAAPTPIDAGDEEQVSGAASSPHGTLLWGSHTEYGANHARAWYASQSETFKPSATYAFNDVLPYHSSSVNEALWVNDRWVSVGSKSTNGRVRRSALAMTSIDGLTWTQGTPAAIERRGDTFNRSDPLTDLDGLEHSGRGMAAVAALGTGVVSVGWSENADVTQASFWLSPDVKTWTLASLPHEGLTSSTATSVAAVGTTIVAVGSGVPASDGLSTGYVWTSGDGGKHWSRQHLGADQPAQQLKLTSQDGRFLIVQSQQHDLALKGWTSVDGVTWTPSEVDLPDRAKGVRASIVDVLPRADGVDMLVRVDDNADGQTLVHHVKIG